MYQDIAIAGMTSFGNIIKSFNLRFFAEKRRGGQSYIYAEAKIPVADEFSYLKFHLLILFSNKRSLPLPKEGILLHVYDVCIFGGRPDIKQAHKCAHLVQTCALSQRISTCPI